MAAHSTVPALAELHAALSGEEPTPHPDFPWPLLLSVAAVAEAPLDEMARRLRDATLPYIANSGLIIFTEDCIGWPRKVAGDSDVVSRVSIAELAALRDGLSDEAPWFGEAEIGARPRPVLALGYAPSHALLVLTDPGPFDTEAGADLALLSYMWHIAAGRILERVTDAPPSYLLESRSASVAHVRVTAELTDRHSLTLKTLLEALRSPVLDDAAARSEVIDLTTKALIGLRALNDRTMDLVYEPVASALERLREELRLLMRFSGIEVEFIEPPLDGATLSGEVGQAARATVQAMITIMMEQPEISKIRIKWDCDNDSLLIDIRDDGGGALSVCSPRISRLDRRVRALDGQLRIDVVPGWGTDVFVALPKQVRRTPTPPTTATGDMAGWTTREIEVLGHLAEGRRNRAIAEALGISENTVKFHVRNLFDKLGVNSRSEVVAMALGHSHVSRVDATEKRAPANKRSFGTRV